MMPSLATINSAYILIYRKLRVIMHDTNIEMWRHNGRDSVSNHQPHDCLLNRLFRRRSKKTSKLHVTGLYARNSPGTGEFPAQMASNAENLSIWWRHHEIWHHGNYRVSMINSVETYGDFSQWINCYIISCFQKVSATCMIYLFGTAVVYWLIINLRQYAIHILKCSTTARPVSSKIVTEIQVWAGSHCISFYIQYHVILDRVSFALTAFGVTVKASFAIAPMRYVSFYVLSVYPLNHILADATGTKLWRYLLNVNMVFCNEIACWWF